MVTILLNFAFNLLALCTYCIKRIPLLSSIFCLQINVPPVFTISLYPHVFQATKSALKHSAEIVNTQEVARAKQELIICSLLTSHIIITCIAKIIIRNIYFINSLIACLLRSSILCPCRKILVLIKLIVLVHKLLRRLTNILLLSLND